MNIIYLAFGENINHHLQVVFSVLSCLRYLRKQDSVTIYTDYPCYYKRLGEKVSISVLDKDLLDKWIAGTNYIYRAKIKAIEKSVKENPDTNLIFLDGDTILHKNGFIEIEEILNSGRGIMYRDEGHPSKMKGPSLRMWNAMKGKTVDNCTISIYHNVWNSGVIGIPKNKNCSIVTMALKFCDLILKTDAKCFITEQYAFSIAMQHYCGLVEARQWITHYWGNKEQWNQMAMEFFAKSYLTGRDLDGELKDFDSLPIHSTPIHIKKSNTQRRLTNVIKKLFPNKIIE